MLYLIVPKKLEFIKRPEQPVGYQRIAEAFVAVSRVPELFMSYLIEADYDDVVRHGAWAEAVGTWAVETLANMGTRQSLRMAEAMKGDFQITFAFEVVTPGVGFRYGDGMYKTELLRDILQVASRYAIYKRERALSYPTSWLQVVSRDTFDVLESSHIEGLNLHLDSIGNFVTWLRKWNANIPYAINEIYQRHVSDVDPSASKFLSFKEELEQLIRDYSDMQEVYFKREEATATPPSWTDPFRQSTLDHLLALKMKGLHESLVSKEAFKEFIASFGGPTMSTLSRLFRVGNATFSEDTRDEDIDKYMRTYEMRLPPEEDETALPHMQAEQEFVQDIMSALYQTKS